MRKVVILLVLFLNAGLMLGQEGPKQGHEESMAFNKPDAFIENIVIWVSVAIVIATLYITLKYMFFPGEKDPHHIKNIVTDEGIE